MKRLLSLFFALTLSSIGLFAQTVYTLGTGTSTTTDTPPYKQYWTGNKAQYLILASELTALGATAGPLVGIAFDVVTPAPPTSSGGAPDGSNLRDFTVKVGTTALTALTTTWVTGLTQVYTVPSFITTVGWNNHIFTSSFSWDGVSNIIIETCFDNYLTASNYSSSASVTYTATPATSVNYRGTDGGGVCASTTTGTTSSNRPNIRLLFPGQPNDVGITAITAPVTPANLGSNTVSVRLTNFASNTLSNVTIAWSINGVPQTPFPWSGTLASGADVIVPLGNGNFVLGNNVVVAGVLNPNGNVDPNPANDQTTANIFACGLLSGTYTIGTSGTFASLEDAIFALNTCGVGGPVVFNVLPGSGPFAGGFELGAITGISAANTVTFNGNGAIINEGTASYIVGFNGATYITWNDFQIVNTVPATGKFGILIRGNSQYLNITNNVVDVGMGTTSSSASGIVVSNSLSSATSTGTNGQYLTIAGNEVIGGYYGITLIGSASYLNCVGNTVSDNIVRDFYYYGIYLNNTDNTTVTGNQINRMVRTSVSSTTYALYMSTTKKSQVLGNQIYGFPTGSTFYGIYVSTSVNTSGNETEIINNAFYDISTTSTNYIIYLGGTRDYINVYYNTVHLDVSTAGTKYAFYSTGAPNNHNLRNNIFSIQGSGTGTKYCIYIGTTSASFSSDYNNLYMGATGGTANHVGYWPSSARTTLLNWQTASGQDANSVSIDPLFPAVNDIKTKVIGLWQAGTPIAGVTTDLYGTLRHATTPCIGAYEYVLYTRDAGVTEMTEPLQACPGIQAVKVKIKNHGVQAFTNATINWSVNGVPQTPATYSGTLAAGTETEVNIGTYNFLLNVVYNLVFHTTNPGGSADLNPVNDTLKVNGFRTGLNGTYSIGIGGSHAFNTIEAAVQALNAYGVCGPVTFNVAAGSGPYTGGLEFGVINGVDATNTITFNGNGATINESSATYILAFNGSTYITINNFRIVNTDPSVNKFGIMVRGASEYLTFIHNYIDVGTTSTSTTTAGIAVSNSTTSATTAGSNGQYLTIANNEIVGGYYGITLMGAASYLNCMGNTVADNIIRDFYVYGIYLSNNDGTMVTRNNVHRPTRETVSTFYGVYMTSSRAVKVLKNKFHTSGIGSYTAYPIYLTASVNIAGSETEFINNAIYNIPTTGIIYGIYALGTGNTNINFYYNTVDLRLSGSSTSNKRAFFASTAFTNFNVKNNIFSIQGDEASTKYCMYITSTSTSFYSNYNNLYMGATGGTNLCGYYGADQSTLADWQTATGQDANSLALDPIFTSTTNPTPVKYQLDNKGNPIAGIVDDINGTLRNATTPDIGAVEFVAPTNPIMVLSKLSHDFGYVEVGKNRTFQLTISNVGPSTLIIFSKTIGSPFSIVTTPATGFITIPIGGSTTATVRYAPTSVGDHSTTLLFGANTTVLNLSVQLQGKAYPAGKLVEDFEGPVFPPVGWELIQGPCSPTNDMVRTIDQSVSPSNSMKMGGNLICSSGYNQYAITPRVIVDASNSTFSFWYRKSTTTAITLRVGWSSTGKNVNTDFTWNTVTIAGSNTWYQYEKTDLPIGTKYLAIHYNYTTYSSLYNLYIDDVFGPPISPYDVLATSLDANQTIPTNTSFNYRVAVKNSGPSADVYNLSVSSAKGFTYAIRNKLDNANITTLSLAAGAVDTIIVKATVLPAGINTGDVNTGTLMAVSQGNSAVRDSASFTTTAVVPFTPPYLQPFNTFANGPYEYWTEAKGLIANPTVFTDPSTSYWTGKNFGNVGGHPNGTSAYMNVYYSNTIDWLISPVFQLGAKSTFKLEFDIALTVYNSQAAASLTGNDTIALVISTDAGKTWNKSNILKVWDASTPISNTGEHVIIDLTPYSGMVKFAFYVSKPVSAGDIDFFVDNVALVDPTALPDCIAGGLPADSAVDVAPNVTLSWPAASNTLGYKLYFGTTNPPPFVGNLGNVLTYNPGLLPYNATYYWKVVPYSQGGDALGCPVWQFTTLTPFSLPFVEDFTTMTSTPPAYWSEATGIIDNPTVFTLNSSVWSNDVFGNDASHVNGNSAWINIYGSDRYGWLISPFIDLGAPGTIYVEFDLALTAYALTTPSVFDGDDTLALVISTDGGLTWNKSNIVKMWNAADVISAAGEHVSLTLTGYSGLVKFGFYGQSRLSGADVDVFVDNFMVLGQGILGKVNYQNAGNTKLGNVDVHIVAQSKTVSSDLGGNFGFMPLANGTYDLTASSLEDVGGINSTDALLAMRHFVGLNLLSGLPAMAADVTASSGINAADALEIQKFYIKMVNTFPAGPWQFTPVSVNVAGGVSTTQLYGLCTGDVNGSFVPGAKAENVVALYLNDEMSIPANRRVQIPVYAAQTMDMGAVSLTLDYPASRLKIENVTTQYPAENLIWKAENGKLVITWFDLSGMTAVQGSEIFTIQAVASYDAEVISFQAYHGEFATNQGLVIQNAAISIPKLVTRLSGEGLVLNSYPNPSSGLTTFTYEVNEPGKVVLEVFNSLGAKVSTLVNQVKDAGIYQTSFDGSNLSSGIYIGKLSINGESATLRLIITE